MFDFTPKHDFLVGIDSDGCAFDSMEIKHKECFIPNTIKHYGLQAVSKYAREAAEFVNLYSKSRGINRFPALIETLEWVNKRPEVRARGVKKELPKGVVDWLARETKLGDASLEVAVKETSDADLVQALEWSKAVNDTVRSVVEGVPPYPLVKESLEKLAAKADVLVVSATPNEALEREWEEHGLRQYVAEICGQDTGTKKETLTVASKYGARKSLMIGDAPGDHKAGDQNNCLFYPINPGKEEASWQRFYEETIDKFFDGTFDDEYQKMLMAEFDACLPAQPPWPVIED